MSRIEKLPAEVPEDVRAEIDHEDRQTMAQPLQPSAPASVPEDVLAELDAERRAAQLAGDDALRPAFSDTDGDGF